MHPISLPNDHDYGFEIGDTVVNRFCGTIYKVIQRALLPWLDGDREAYTVEDADGFPHLIIGDALTRRKQ